MTILVVEDDFASRELLKRYLHGLGQVDAFENAEDGLKSFSEKLHSGDNYDLICLDIMLPGMNGQELLKNIRKDEESLGILGLQASKVIMLTAMRDASNIMEAFRSQCESYLPKPLDKGRLWAEIKQLGLPVPE